MRLLPCQEDLLSTHNAIQTRCGIIHSYRCEIAEMDCYLSEPDADLLLTVCDGCEKVASLE